MKHLTRAGALLAILITVFLLLKLMPTPTFLEQYGFRQSEDNAKEWSSLSPLYADSSRCSECHQDKHSVWMESKHSTVSCENCHGPATAHIETNASLIIVASRESCGLCHDQLLSKPSDFPQIDLDEHGGQLECITCHNPHDPEVAAPPRIPHTLEGRPDCLVCHKAGGIKPFPQDHTGRDKGTCLNCHTTE
ncbi:MAG: hypothetical protein ACYSSO_14070 [Planctomycetota bacterium]